MDWTEHGCVVTDKVLYVNCTAFLADDTMTPLLINREHYISKMLNGQNIL